MISGRFALRCFTVLTIQLSIIFPIYPVAKAAISTRRSAAPLVGPFFLWGVPQLKDSSSIGALQGIDVESLRDIYAEAETIVVFVRNGSAGPLRTDAFPSFVQLLAGQDWTYSAQLKLKLDPIEHGANAEIITLVGDTSQQDVEISALFNDAVLTYGPQKVLGILAYQGTPEDESNDHSYDFLTYEAPPAEAADEPHSRRRRADVIQPSSTEASSTGGAGETTATESAAGVAAAGATDETMEENFIYIAPGKAMMYTTAPPVLTTEGSAPMELRKHGIVTSDERKDEFVRLIVTFKGPETASPAPDDVTKLVLRFRFPIAGDYWTLASVELEETLRNGGEAPRKTELTVAGEAPGAPLGFSYKCSQAVVFRHNATTLTLQNVQVEPMLVADHSFSDAYDCVGFVTGGILSGFFVVGMLTTVLFVALGCIANIKTPNKFENNRGKQLTFVVQE